MSGWARAAIFSATTLWVLAWVATAFLIYGPTSFDWGRGGFSLGLLFQVIAGLAFMSLLGAAIGFRLGAGNARMPGKLLSAMVGAFALVLSNVVLFSVPYALYSAAFFVGATFFASSLILAFVAATLINRCKPVPSNTSLERMREG